MISLRVIIRGVLTRFLPGYALGAAALLALGALTGGITVGWSFVIQQCGVLTVGYWGALVALRFRLRATADVGGRRSLLAGILSPAAVLTAMVVFRSFALPGSHTSIGLLVVSTLVGVTMGLAMFFPWLKTPAVQALTDEEARSLLTEGAVDWEGALAARPEEVPTHRDSAPRE